MRFRASPYSGKTSPPLIKRVKSDSDIDRSAESRLFQAAQYFEEECHDGVRREVERSATAWGENESA